MAYFVCGKCKREKETPGKIVLCLGCNRKLHVCKACAEGFVACSDECRQTHRALMKECWAPTAKAVAVSRKVVHEANAAETEDKASAQ